MIEGMVLSIVTKLTLMLCVYSEDSSMEGMPHTRLCLLLCV